MEVIDFFIDFILHLDKHLVEIVNNYRVWTYLILFLIVFCETGLVITPFLPGDSLLFACGTIAATGALHIGLLMLILFIAAFGGDNTNYWIGNYIGPKAFSRNYRFLKKEYLLQTQAFYDKHGGKTVFLGRFMPFVRTFVPFVAGVGSMKYLRFVGFSFTGNLAWIGLFCLGGFLFGNIPAVKENFSIGIIGIIIVSLLPTVYGISKAYIEKRKLNAKK